MTEIGATGIEIADAGAMAMTGTGGATRAKTRGIGTTTGGTRETTGTTDETAATCATDTGTTGETRATIGETRAMTDAIAGTAETGEMAGGTGGTGEGRWTALPPALALGHRDCRPNRPVCRPTPPFRHDLTACRRVRPIRRQLDDGTGPRTPTPTPTPLIPTLATTVVTVVNLTVTAALTIAPRTTVAAATEEAVVAEHREAMGAAEAPHSRPLI